jgi:hypothetical protein
MDQHIAINHTLQGVIDMYKRCKTVEEPTLRLSLYEDAIVSLDENFSEKVKGLPEEHYLYSLRVTPREPLLLVGEAEFAWRFLENIKAVRFTGKKEIVTLEKMLFGDGGVACLPEADYMSALVKHLSGKSAYGLPLHYRRQRNSIDLKD